VSNIFLKDCPQCASSNPVEAVFCRCGYCFDPNQIRNTAESLAHMAHEEEVYLEYLQARTTQARADLEARRVAVARDPDNNTKSAELLLATQALSTAEAEYHAQQAKVQALSNHKNAVRFVRHQAREASEKLNAKKKKRTTQNVTRRTKGKKKTTSMTRGASRAVTPNQPSTLKQDQAVVVARRAAASVPRPAPVLKRPAPPLAAKPPGSVSPARPAPVAKPATPPARPAATPPPAPALVRDIEIRQPAPPVSAAATIRPVTSSTPTPEFRASQATRAQEVTAPAPLTASAPPRPQPAPHTKECPHCTASLPLQATNCRCGYNFGHAAELPALTLSSAELASILGALGGLSSSGNR
jgi:ribosomal protein L40E